jgi:CRISPR system Cascade subunit CasC
MKTIEFHILQNFPPSNLNRDDSGAPKDCDFGGYRRQRISSQCLKRSVRQSDVFQELLNGRLGIRTKRAPEQVAQRLVAGGYQAAPARAAAEALFDALYKLDENGKTKYLLYVGAEELQRAATLLLEAGPELVATAEQLATLSAAMTSLPKKEREAIQKELAEAAKPFAALAEQYKKQYPRHVRSVDVALFGRMLADNPTENIDAACQVSHALSVNRLNMEFDYFTAVDDLPNEDNNPGAGMIGTVGFASSCFYRFACVNVDQLTRNLGGDATAAHEGILAFAEAFVQARPSGKQNTFAAHSLPALVLVVAREAGQPVSLVNAFEVPIRPTEQAGLTTGAIRALGRHYAQLRQMYGLRGNATCVVLDGTDSEATQALRDAGVTAYAGVPDLLASLRTTLTT